MPDKQLLSVVTPCYNEAENIEVLYRRVKATIAPLAERYEFEIIIIDNHSTDATPDKLRALAAVDPGVKVIFTTRNFGHIRSPYYGILQSQGLATIYLASDLQDPPEMISEFIHWWEQGYKLVLATKPVSQSSRLIHYVRRSYYRMLESISDITLVSDSTGFGLYDQVVLAQLRRIGDPNPYLRGLICELGWEVKTIPFNQPCRARGVSKNNFYTLYDIAMLGIVSHSKVPIRIAAFIGFAFGAISFVAAVLFTVLKLLFWNSFPMGIAPLMIGMFFMFGVLLMFISILGEYIASIHTYVQNRPVVIEQERLNFTSKP